MKINYEYNDVAGITARRLIEVARRRGILLLTENHEDNLPELKYGISNLSLSKSEQAKEFGKILPNTIIVMKDHDVVVMKNPTRVLLWQDAKRQNGTKYKYIKNKEEWRINYSFGRITAIQNKNIGDNIFGKADITQWTGERDSLVISNLTKITNDIAKRVHEISDLKAFGLDIIRDKNTGQFYFLELNQANSLSERQLDCYLDGFLATLEKPKVQATFTEIEIDELDKSVVDSFLELLNDNEKMYLKQKLGG
jgi:hypothetical protein